MGTFSILQGDVRDWLPLFPDSHFDACFCDPPYFLEFMGKEFDRQHKKMKGEFGNDGQRMQAWHETWAREVLRVLKPGGHMLAFGGTRTYHRLASAAEDVGFEVRDMLAWLHGQGFPKGKTQLKPAEEPILLARKSGKILLPLNLESCRIGTEKVITGFTGKIHAFAGTNSRPCHSIERKRENTEHYGRWPANLILSHHEACNEECHPDCPVRMLDEQSGITKSTASGYNFEKSGNSNPSRVTTNIKSGVHFGDKGGASRFFYTAKVSSRERNLGGIDCRHPTLKPISLTAYLSRLLLPPPQPDFDLSTRRLLIPFSGAGSEIVGALLAGWDEVTGIEQDPEYIGWAEARIPAALESLSHLSKV